MMVSRGTRSSGSVGRADGTSSAGHERVCVRRSGGFLPVGGVRGAEAHSFIDQLSEVWCGGPFAQPGNDISQVVPDGPRLPVGVLQEMSQQASPVARLGRDIEVLEAAKETAVLVEARLGTQDKVDCLVTHTGQSEAP